MALGLWNHIQLQWGGPMEVTLKGEGSNHIPRDKRNLIYRAAQRVMSELGVSDTEFRVTANQEVPLSRGLGSSSCAIVGGLVAANALFDDPIPLPRLLEIATDMEGHPDNVAAALLGGCRIVVQEGSELQAAPVPLPADLQCVVYIPDQPMPTRQARAVLPLKVSRRDAVFNIGRTALL
ncbi:MAG: homoserine kinase, partial [Chloroflexi bacterium]|nr:homoserine kinase [Chloroflexota bacterium]